jgi:hypothetical protein
LAPRDHTPDAFLFAIRCAFDEGLSTIFVACQRLTVDTVSFPRLSSPEISSPLVLLKDPPKNLSESFWSTRSRIVGMSLAAITLQFNEHLDSQQYEKFGQKHSSIWNL